jgi:predicted Ser/Thr protein kinase
VLEYNKSNLYESAILENPIRVCPDVLRTIYETDYGFRARYLLDKISKVAQNMEI